MVPLKHPVVALLVADSRMVVMTMNRLVLIRLLTMTHSLLDHLLMKTHTLRIHLPMVTHVLHGPRTDLENLVALVAQVVQVEARQCLVATLGSVVAIRLTMKVKYPSQRFIPGFIRGGRYTFT